MKGSRVKTIEAVRRVHKQSLEEGWKKTSIFEVIFNFKKHLYYFLQLLEVFSGLKNLSE